MKTAYVYILRSEDARYYVGSTTNLENRIKHHQNGYTYSTSRMKNPVLVFKQEFSSALKARQMERKIKSWKRRDFIEKIIIEGYIRSV